MKFAPISESDFPLLSEWLQSPHVALWWDEDPSLNVIAAKYSPRILEEEACEVFIAHFENTLIGLIQRYRYDSYPEYIDEIAPLCEIPDDAFSIDYFIGPEQFLRRGFGSLMIREFVEKIWRERSDASSVIVPTHATNIASHRSLERAGFSLVAKGELAPDNPSMSRDHLVYRIDRREERSNQRVD
jgi:aminoglycoside 6'-N-acetyltransferase